MAEAAANADLDPDRLSFIPCLRILRLRLPECAGGSAATYQRWYTRLLAEMSQER